MFVPRTKERDLRHREGNKGPVLGSMRGPSCEEVAPPERNGSACAAHVISMGYVCCTHTISSCAFLCRFITTWQKTSPAHFTELHPFLFTMIAYFYILQKILTMLTFIMTCTLTVNLLQTLSLLGLFFDFI